MRFSPYSVHEHHIQNNYISQFSYKGKSAGEWGFPLPGLKLLSIGMSRGTFWGAFSIF